jgi:2Fe-2S ferredoxin
MKMISFQVDDNHGSVRLIEIPEGISLSLMEVLKASEYSIPATCGGMALCATCHVEVKKGLDSLPPAKDIELDMIDTLPNATGLSRLACQIHVTEEIQDAVFLLKGDHRPA